MKKLTFFIAFLLCVSVGFAQEQKEKMLLGMFSSHEEHPEYVYGKIKEIHYQVFHVIEENGKVVKGKPFKWADSGNVALRQPWSYYYNELGQLVKKSAKTDNGIQWTGVVHNANNRIENIYWLKLDTLMGSDNFTYLENGNIEQRWKSVQNNESGGYRVCELDKKGYLTKSTAYNKEGKVIWTSEYARNPDGTVSICKGSNNDSLLNFYNNYKYNEKGLFESQHIELLGGKEVNFPQGGKVEYEYDKNGNWIKSNYWNWMMIERRFVYY